MLRSLLAVVIGVAGLVALLPSAEAKDRGSCARHIAPVCHLGESAVCLRSNASDFSCAWQCVRS